MKRTNVTQTSGSKCAGFALALAALASPAHAQLRIATYNTLLGPNVGMSTVLEAMGRESVLGVARPLDILLLQEQDEPSTTTQTITHLLNDLYGPGVYRRGFLATGPSFSSLRQSVVYNSQTVTLLEEEDIGLAGGAPRQPRESLRLRFRPVGYDDRSDFYVYNSHFKAGGNPSDFDRRTVEAIALRADADSLGDDAHVLFTGDFNLRSGSDDAFQELLSPGPAAAFDPEDFPGQWKNNFGARTVHTHGTGDVDDRFDFQLPTLEWRDGEGLDLIEGSYRVFGNNGTTYNQPVNSFANTYPLDLGEGAPFTRQDVLNSLRTASDHLPVVADYQVPAILTASIDPLPDEIALGSELDLSLFVENVADVVAPIGADELDYAVTWSGDNSGSLIGTDLADGLADENRITLDTSTPGSKATSFVIESDSPGVMNGMLAFTLNYDVVAAAGDFNLDGAVDAADYTVWRDSEGQTGPGLAADANGDEAVDQLDHEVWALNYGHDASPSEPVPEPIGWALALLGGGWLACRCRGPSPTTR